MPVRYVVCCWALLWAGPAMAQFRPSFAHMTEIGVTMGRVKFGMAQTEVVSNRINLTAKSFNGIQLRPKLAVGGVVGIDWYNAALLMPVGAGLRYDLVRRPDRSFRLFTSLDAGYGLAWLHEDTGGNKTTGGLYVSPGIGLRIGRPRHGNFVLTMRYKRQEAEVDRALNGPYLYRREERTYNRLAFGLGIAL